MCSPMQCTPSCRVTPGDIGVLQPPSLPASQVLPPFGESGLTINPFGSLAGACACGWRITNLSRNPLRYQVLWSWGVVDSRNREARRVAPAGSSSQLDCAIHSANFDHLRVSTLPLTAIPTACFWPTKTTSFLPLVMPV